MNILNKNAIIFLVIIMRVKLTDWMSEIGDETNLFTISIPGTHDSATKYVQFSHFARCQNLSIYDQLNIGIRALDIRVKSNGEKLELVHGIAKTFATAGHNAPSLNMGYILEHCYAFLEQHPTEAIIFQFKNDDGRENEKCFDNLFYTYVKGNEDKWYLKAKAPTMAEARGKLVLIRRCNMNRDNPDFTCENTGIDFSRWPEQPEVVPDALPLRAGELDFIIQDRYNYKPEPRWSECIKPFLDGRKEYEGEYIIEYLSTAGGTKGPEANAEYINAQFLQYPLEKGKYYGIIYFDFPTEELVKKIINHNLGE